MVSQSSLSMWASTRNTRRLTDKRVGCTHESCKFSSDTSWKFGAKIFFLSPFVFSSSSSSSSRKTNGGKRSLKSHGRSDEFFSGSFIHSFVRSILIKKYKKYKTQKQNMLLNETRKDTIIENYEEEFVNLQKMLLDGWMRGWWMDEWMDERIVDGWMRG